jgi:cyclase
MKYIRIVLMVASFVLIRELFSQENPAFKISKLTEGIYELVADGGGYPVKVLLSVGEDGVLMVDSGDKELGDALVDAIKTFDKGLPKVIINTHSHIEHLGGNIAIGKGPVIIGHENLRDRYVNGLYVFNGVPETALPNITFTDSMNLYFNGEKIRLMAYPGAHDNSDIIVWFTKSKVVFTAALCMNHHFPSVDGELGDILKYPETVSGIISLLPEDVRLVPGHSDDCTMKEYREFYDMLVETSGIIRTELVNGKSLDELQDEEILAAWKTWESYVDLNTWIKYWVDGIQHPKQVSTKKKVYAPVYYAIRQKGADSAIALYHQLKTKHPDEYQFEEKTTLWIGRRLAYTGKNDDAIKFLNLCLEENPNTEASSIGYYTLGNIYLGTGDKKSAIEYYRKYLERFPKDQKIINKMKELEKQQ